ncbi:hypothetical protein DV738_g2813, partial [Chaetothyriales sp. CBS 135597]
MEDICSVGGTKLPPVPAIPPDSVPNLEPISKVYNMNFAPGLDKLLESDNHWFANEGFKLVASDRTLLGLVLAYLTLISNNADNAVGEDATLASQEARVTYGSLRQCVHLEHDGGREGEKLARRFRTIESILTGEPLAVPPASMSEFVDVDMDDHQPDPSTVEGRVDGDGGDNEGKHLTAFDKQVAKRQDEFWKMLELIATVQGPRVGEEDAGSGVVGGGGGGSARQEDVQQAMEQIKSLAEGRENRDILYAILLLGWGKNGDPSSERELAKRFLQSEAQGRATELVFATIAGMGLRAFGES